MRFHIFKKKYHFLLFLLCTIIPLASLQSQENIALTNNPKQHKQEGVYKSYRDKAAYPFVVYDPQFPDSVKAPVILFLHGRSLSGTDLKKVFSYGVLDAIGRGKEIPAIVVAPQVSKSQFWEPDKVLSVLNFVQKNYVTDLQKVYVVGMSLGGYGTLAFAGKYPERMAAGVAMCGGGNTNDACNIAATNMWIMHGEKDRAVPVSESITIYEAITSCDQKGDCHLTLYPQFGHGELAKEFYKDTLYNWLFQYQLSDTSYKELVLSSTPDDIAIDHAIQEEPETLEIEVSSSASMHSPSNPNKPSYHIIQKGDTLYGLSRKYGIPLSKLYALNGLNEQSILHIKQKIRLY